MQEQESIAPHRYHFTPYLRELKLMALTPPNLNSKHITVAHEVRKIFLVFPPRQYDLIFYAQNLCGEYSLQGF